MSKRILALVSASAITMGMLAVQPASADVVFRLGNDQPVVTGNNEVRAARQEGKAEIRDAKRDGRREIRDARHDPYATKRERRQNVRAAKQEMRQEVRAERQEKREDVRDAKDRRWLYGREQRDDGLTIRIN